MATKRFITTLDAEAIFGVFGFVDGFDVTERADLSDALRHS